MVPLTVPRMYRQWLPPTLLERSERSNPQKPNKPDYQALKAYRIIALLNCLGKIAEKLVAKRLSQLCEDNHLLHEGQMGGRPHRSAIDAILALTHDVELGQQQQLVTSALFMDVKGAFDNVSRHRLIHTMT